MAPKHFNIVIVVSGVAQPVRVQPQEKIAHMVVEALRETGNAGRASEDFELRSDDGALVDQTLRVSDLGLAEGATLFLNPRAGAGG